MLIRIGNMKAELWVERGGKVKYEKKHEGKTLSRQNFQFEAFATVGK